MANHLKGEVVIEAGGRKLTFRLGVNEWISAERVLGLKDGDLLTAMQRIGANQLPLGMIRTVVFHGLVGAQPDITEVDAGNVIVDFGLQPTVAAIIEAIAWALPEQKKPAVGGAKGDKSRPSVGPTSS